MAAVVRGPNLLELAEDESAMSRFLTFEPTFPDVKQMWKAMKKVHWHSNEVEIGQEDVAGFNKLPRAQQNMVRLVLAFFAAADGVVNENIMVNFSAEIPYGEVRQVYAEQQAIEAEHQEVYGDLLMTYAPDPAVRKELAYAADTLPCVRNKMAWAQRFMNRACSFAQRLFAFAIMEGFFFQSSFIIIYWFQRGKIQLPGLVSANELIARDENLHYEFAALLYSKLWPEQRISREQAFEVMDEALRVEELFVRTVICEPFPGLNADSMMQCVRHWANCVLDMFGYGPAPGEAPRYGDAFVSLEWLQTINMQKKANFFEVRNFAYGRSNNSEAKYDERVKRMRRGDDVDEDDFNGFIVIPDP